MKALGVDEAFLEEKFNEDHIKSDFEALIEAYPKVKELDSRLIESLTGLGIGLVVIGMVLEAAIRLFQLASKKMMVDHLRSGIMQCLSKIFDLEMDEDNYEALKNRFQDYALVAQKIKEESPLDFKTLQERIDWYTDGQFHVEVDFPAPLAIPAIVTWHPIRSTSGDFLFQRASAIQHQLNEQGASSWNYFEKRFVKHLRKIMLETLRLVDNHLGKPKAKTDCCLKKIFHKNPKNGTPH